jgi:hypothetical protein
MLGCVLRWMAFDWGVAEIRNCDWILHGGDTNSTWPPARVTVRFISMSVVSHR